MAEGYLLTELLTRVSAMVGLTPDAGVNDARVYQAITAAGRAAATWKGVDWWWLHGRGSFVPTNKTVDTKGNSGAVRSSGVVTITTTANHGLVVGQYVRITGVTDSTMDGTFIVASQNGSDEFTYSDAGDNSTSGAGTVYAASYPLRTINSAEMASARAVERVYQDVDWAMRPVTWRRFRELSQLAYDNTENEPTNYTVTEESNTGPILHLVPIPNTTDRIYVDYVKFHLKMVKDIAATNLIVPFDYQEGVYVGGAAWLLRNDAGAATSLNQCPEFVEAMDRMSQSEPANYDRNPADDFLEPGGASGQWPQDRGVAVYPDGYLIRGEMSL